MTIEELEVRITALEEGHKRHRDRIKENRTGIRASLAVLVFAAVVWGVPIASIKWNNEEFHFTRDTTSPELVLIGGLLAASLFMGSSPTDLIKSIITRK